MGDPISLADYYDQLQNAPWYYQMNDDSRSFENGRARMAVLESQKTQSDDHRGLYAAVKEHKFSGPHWDNELIPLPARPEEKEKEIGN